MALVVKQVTDDAAYELWQMGVKAPDLGRIMRLISNGEDEYCRHTGVLFAEAKMNTVAGTYDYDFNLCDEVVSPKIISEIHAVKYRDTWIRLVSYGAQSGLPAYFTEDYAEFATYVAEHKVRLSFNPASGTDYLGFLYSYEPHTAVILPSASLSVDSTHRAALLAYVLWHYLLPTDPEKAVKLYRDQHFALVNIERKKVLTRLKSIAGMAVKDAQAAEVG